MNDISVDVVIIGAGVSGINAAHRIQTQFPNFSYIILEARDQIGGTWDLFKYPGIRSDSDLYTFGFPWQLWSSEKAIADGPAIKKYMIESAKQFGIDSKILFGHRLISADWSSKDKAWSLDVHVQGGKVMEHRTVRAGFVLYGSGYYDYEVPLKTIIPGLERFKGAVIHPQFWPEDLDYTNKRVIIIGSGATAVTLLPVLSEKAASVTMLQRSPTYILSALARDRGSWIRNLLPSFIAHRLVRWKFMWLMFFYFQFCRAFPALATRQIKAATEKELPDHIRQDPNFKPAYNPWEQRLCVCPDGDFYRALREKNGDVVTDTVDSVVETGIRTTGGKHLVADIIITATGLKMRIAGGAQISVDGTVLRLSDKFIWKGTMVQDIPNTAFLLGYTNASWTLGAEASIQLMCRVMRAMIKQGALAICPRVQPGAELNPRSMMNLSSTYIKAGGSVLPKAGDRGPWLAKSNYFRDVWNAKFGDVKDGLEYS
ncbi:FAD/NAD(P)-binding domain-containing protein [Cadophora sp. DSE1049]|nr:FAD/NAD(P)-binding domain-containing protein [Cadophora sp. DSE1049]